MLAGDPVYDLLGAIDISIYSNVRYIVYSLSKNRMLDPSTSFLTVGAIPNLPAHASTRTTGFLALANLLVISSTTCSVTWSEDAAIAGPVSAEVMVFVSVLGGSAVAVDSGGGAA